MRLWHKDLIPYLPRQQLLGQWRELCYIAKSIATKGTPNHILVNKIVDYPPEHLVKYALEVATTMVQRGYQVNIEKFMQYVSLKPSVTFSQMRDVLDIFPDWHNDRYFWQCYYNLQEKYDCGGLTDEEWGVVVDSVNVCIKER